MTIFEWIVIVLLVLILLKPREKPSRLEGERLALMRQYEMRLINIEMRLAEISASTNSTSHDIGAMRISQLPEYPPDDF
jgi:hypothetical protein